MPTFVHYYKKSEELNTAIDVFLKNYGDGMSYANAQPLLEKEGINVSKPKYNARVLHCRRERYIRKNNQSNMF